MAEIHLDRLAHSYTADPAAEADWALKEIDLTWADGGAYALLGPSGCGKTTLLNIISGLVAPSQGRVLFDGADVTGLAPDRRQIAQVFQFPVIYDTMTVRDNLAFPLRNRGVAPAAVDTRVRDVASMLELDGLLDRRAQGLTADQKQKISMGRGLVREDVNVIMFDEPLTVIDPHMKWTLRSKLKELHQRVGLTMIYVTHDQTEALTFADQVVVMQAGQVVQVGTPVDLFERPAHTFVGHFIGSPGMNVLPCERDGAALTIAGHRVPNVAADPGDGALEIGIRPEFVRFDAAGLPVRIERVADTGRHRIVEMRLGDHGLRSVVADGVELPAEPRIGFQPDHTHLYRDGWLIGGGA
ncbi:MAG: ABC transporter ATP-binding protein [Pseudomonadota bacterium]